MKYITVALAKGRLADFAVGIFRDIGFDCSEMDENSRKLIFTDKGNKFKFIMVKAADVPVYVEYGAADIGIVGKDTLLEEGRNLYEMLDLGFGKCVMAVAGKAESVKLSNTNNIRVATKYPNIAKNYFHVTKGQTIEIIKLNGSVELAPLIGLSEVIVDIVESGRTLKDNGLCVLEEICPISARLVINRISMKLEKDRIASLVNKISAHIKKGEKK